MLVLIDHQIGLYTGVRDISVEELKHNITGICRNIENFGPSKAYLFVAGNLLAALFTNFLNHM